MPLEIYLLSDCDSFQEKRKKMNVDLRENRVRDLIAQINTLSHREFYHYEELGEKITLYSEDKKDTIELGVVYKIKVWGDPMDWIQKVSPRFKELGVITKTKCYVPPQEIDRLKQEIEKLRGSLGEGKRKDVEDIRYGIKVNVKEGAWSRFWEALEYSLDLSSQYNLILYVPTIASLLEQ